jgi:uncharacterized protein YbjT (DUF2867 family)
MATVLVVGGTGMLGRPVVRRLLKDGFRVRVLARNPGKAKALLPSSVEIAAGDLSRPESLDESAKGIDALYVSVETLPGAKFHPETEGLRNIAAAARKHGRPRLLVLSALGSSSPEAQRHVWWHAREKFEAQQIAKKSGLPWTIFEPTWFMESIPLFVSGKNFIRFTGRSLDPYWISGDDYGRIISAALSNHIGMGEILRVQGTEKISVEAAGARFARAYDPSIRERRIPFWMLKLGGFFHPHARELATLLDFYSRYQEPEPIVSIWDRFAKPLMTLETYADYVREVRDFPRKH